MSQPTLSMQVQKLEQDYNVILFERNRRRVTTTDIGLKFVEQAQVILLEADKLDQFVLNEQTSLSGEFRIGIIPTLSAYLLPLFLPRFQKNHPTIHLHIVEMQTETLLAELQDGTLDVGILVTPLHSKQILERPLFYEEFYVYASKQHDLLKKEKVQKKDLSLDDLWLLTDGHCFREQALDICKSLKNSKTATPFQFEAGNFETLKNLVDRNLGYTILPELAVQTLVSKEQRPRLRQFAAPAPYREVSLICKSSYLKTNFLDALAEAILTELPKNVQKTKPKQVVEIASYT